MNILNLEENTQLSRLNKDDLFQILLLLNDYYIDYRDKININQDITFGLEIEFENADYQMIDKIIDNLNLKKLSWTKTKWNTVNEITISNGGETKSPILKDNIEAWRQLKLVLENISSNASINKACGAHIHIGKNILNDDINSWKNFLLLWSTYENIIFRFGYGEYLNARPFINRFAAPLSTHIENKSKNRYKNYKNLAKSINEICKNHAFNLDHLSFNCCYGSENTNTIEFRNFNGSLNPIIWQNNVNFITKLLLYCADYNFNYDVVNKRKFDNKNKFQYPIYSYHLINIRQAVELADLIFDNNLDKINFLKQYFKNYQISYEYIKAKKLTKI